MNWKPTLLRKAISLATATSFALVAVPAIASGTVFGRWMTDDGSAIIKVVRCGSKLCGAIEKVLDPQAPANDIHNPDKRLHSSPLVGTMVLQGFSYEDGLWQGGRAYDPKTGKSYRSTVELSEDGNLSVTGCILFLCKTRQWTHAE